ncbi:aldehyde dehydrogenase family protein [Ponticoccus litoralis]|uniref:aldehyde dehydrogenase family protein n=1 Tax=Ponticoccus litoralis TaxID=422297 RepID=UPI003D2EDEFA
MLEDADIDAAVAAAGFGAYMNEGQICMSTERIITVGDAGDRFVEAFRAKVESLTVPAIRARATRPWALW